MRPAACIFCRIIERQLPSKVAYEDENVIVIQDIQPAAPHHFLVIPIRHIERIADLSEEDVPLAGLLIERAKKYAQTQGWSDYRLVFNNGPQAGQTVYHIHLHLLSGRAMSWPPG